MRDFRDAKAMAQTLREILKTRSFSVTHSESLELVASILGFHDWNELAARIQAEGPPPRVVTPETSLPATEGLPAAPEGHLPVVALRDLVFFPLTIAPIFVGRETSKRALECAMAGDRRILAVTQRHAGDDNPTGADLYAVGVTATIIELLRLPNGTIKLLARGLERAAIVQLTEGRFLSAEIASFKESRGSEEEAIALSRAVLEKLKVLRMLNFLSTPYDRLSVIEEPAVLADSVAPLLKCELSLRQDLLETRDVAARLQKILALMQTNQQAA